MRFVGSIMMKTSLKKELVFVIIVLFISMGFIPITNGITQQKQELADNQVKNLILSNIEGKPDLVVTDIYPQTTCTPMVSGMAIWVVNIGDATATGSVHIHFVVKRLLFGIFPIPIYRDEESRDVSELTPGSRIIMHGPATDKIGFYQFCCTINPHKSIEESNYNNNYYSVKFLVLDPEWAWGWCRLN